MKHRIVLVALTAATLVTGNAFAQQQVQATHRKVKQLAPKAYQDVMLGFVGDDFEAWQKKKVDGKDCWISPRISPPSGYEMNHHRVAVDYKGTGSVEISVAHSGSANLGNALSKGHLRTDFQAAEGTEEVTAHSQYKGEDNAWIILRPVGEVKQIKAVRYIYWRGKDTLYGHVPGEFEYKGGTLKYRLMYPDEYNPRRRYPLVVSVSGSGGVGDDNRKSMEMVILGRYLFTDYYHDKNKQCFSLVPQVPKSGSVPEGYWPHNDVGGPTPDYHPGWVTVNENGWWAEATMALVEKLNRELPVDDDRIYATGFSLGGKAVWELLKEGRDVFAAGASGAGFAIGRPFSTPSGKLRKRLAQEVERYKHIPVYIFAGGKDSMRHSAKAVHDVIAEAGGTSRYYEAPNRNHVQSAGSGWKNEEQIDWLFAQRRKARPGPDPYPEGKYPEPQASDAEADSSALVEDDGESSESAPSQTTDR